MTNEKAFAQRLRALRKKAAVTQEELAEEIDVSVMTVRRWEWSERTPRMEEIKRLASVLHVTEAELLSGPVATEWRVEAIFKKEEEWSMDNTVDMSKNGANLFLAQVGMEKIALNLVGSPKDEAELDSLWARLKPQILKMVNLRDGLNEGLSMATA